MAYRCINYLLILIFTLFLSACSRQSHQAQGYVEGRYTYIATSVSGILKQLAVSRGDRVKQGQALFVLEAQPESDVYAASIENVKQAVNARDAIIANLTYAKLTYERYKILVPRNAIQQSQLDSAKATYDATFAQLAQANASIGSAEATLQQNKWTKEQKVGYAPTDALVFDTYYRLGEYTEANKAILSLLAPADIKIIFYVQEKDLGGIHLKDRVKVHCDGCAHDYKAYVSFISPTAEYTPPLIFSNDTNAKLIFRIEAEFNKEDAFHLHPGQPAIVSYDAHD